MARLSPVLVLAAFAAAPAAAQPELTARERAFLDRVTPEVVLAVPGMDAVRVERDRVYGRSGQKADV